MEYKVAKDGSLVGHENDIWKAVTQIGSEETRSVGLKVLGQYAAWISNGYLKGLSQKDFVDIVKSIKAYPVFGERGIERFCARYAQLKSLFEGLWKEVVPHISWSRVSREGVQDLLKKYPNCAQELALTMFKSFPQRTSSVSMLINEQGNTECVYWRPGNFEKELHTSFSLKFDKGQLTQTILLKALKKDGNLGVRVSMPKNAQFGFLQCAPTINVSGEKVSGGFQVCDTDEEGSFSYYHPRSWFFTSLDKINQCHPTIEIYITTWHPKRVVKLGQEISGGRVFIQLETL